MTSHEFDEYQRAVCAAKLAWRRKGRAAKSADNLARKGRGKAWPYRCDVCHRWHVTSSPIEQPPRFGPPRRRVAAETAA